MQPPKRLEAEAIDNHFIEIILYQNSNFRQNKSIEIKSPVTDRKSLPYLSPDGEQRLAGGVHENDLIPTPRRVVFNSKHQISRCVEHREPIPIEEERFPPHGKDYRLPLLSSASTGRFRFRSDRIRRRGVRVDLRHRRGARVSSRRNRDGEDLGARVCSATVARQRRRVNL